MNAKSKIIKCIEGNVSFTLILHCTAVPSPHIHNQRFSSVQLLSCVRLFVTPWIVAHQASLSITNSWSLLRIYWLDILAVQGTLKSLLQHHSSKASILWCSAFFMVQLSHSYMTTGKTIALTRWIFVNKMYLLFNMLSWS